MKSAHGRLYHALVQMPGAKFHLPFMPLNDITFAFGTQSTQRDTLPNPKYLSANGSLAGRFGSIEPEKIGQASGKLAPWYGYG